MTMNRKTWPAFLAVIALFSSLSSDGQKEVQYTSFSGDAYMRYAYTGDKVALLLPSSTYDPFVIQSLLQAYDGAYNFYAQATGSVPSEASTYDGRLTIAVVDDTCGAGCGYLGFTGIELLDDFWLETYDAVLFDNQYDQIVFYELGRNFWFYEDEIALKPPDSIGVIPTGYAVAMRFESMDAAGVDGAPFGALEFEDFRAQVRGLVDQYESDPSLTFDNTIRIGESPLPWGATDLFASFYLRLADEFGCFRSSIWRNVAAMPPALTTVDAIDNFAIAASLSAGRNLADRFREDWRWPISDDAVAALDDFMDPDLSRDLVFQSGLEPCL